MRFNTEILAEMIAICKTYLKNYDGKGIDTWDSVMANPLDGWDINLWQENEDAPLSIVAYLVEDGKINTAIFEDITQEVQNA